MTDNCTPAEAEMTAGYFDGRDAFTPPPSGNRTFCYRHGFANGRDDLSHNPRATADELREMAREAALLDGFSNDEDLSPQEDQ